MTIQPSPQRCTKTPAKLPGANSGTKREPNVRASSRAARIYILVVEKCDGERLVTPCVALRNCRGALNLRAGRYTIECIVAP